MKYSIVEIRPKYLGEIGWDVTYQDLPEQRKNVKPVPHSLGFLYYPTEWGTQKGFDTLKAHMIDRKKYAIKQLQDYLAALEALELK